MFKVLRHFAGVSVTSDATMLKRVEAELERLKLVSRHCDADIASGPTGELLGFGRVCTGRDRMLIK
jgi:hypothetical protein